MHFAAASLIVVLASTLTALAQVPSPPTQPQAGPGGSDYAHASLTTKGPFYAEGPGRQNNYQYFIYEPSSPQPPEAPVVLFIHGWLAYTPDNYLGWIEHITRKGYVVVWVRYDAGLTLPGGFTDKALVSWRDALARLDTEPGHVRPQREGDRMMTAAVGHSVGGLMSAQIALRSADVQNGIPKPYAVVAVAPGGYGILPDEDLSQIDATTKLVVMVGDEDDVVCSLTGLSIWNGTPQIPDESRDFLLVLSDRYGQPDQIADHKFPQTWRGRFGETVDALDFYGTYKMSVAALNCAFHGTDCEVGLGNGSFDQLFMGLWSDGVAMTPMVWHEDPNTLETTCTNRRGLSRSEAKSRSRR